MSALLDALVQRRREQSLEYHEYLKQIAKLAKLVADPASSRSYPPAINTSGRRAMYELVAEDENSALTLDDAIRRSAQDGWRVSRFKLRRIELAIAEVIDPEIVSPTDVLEVAKHHSEY